MEMPDSMDECVYFTRRKFSVDKGKAVCWVRRQECPACKKGMMSKPIDEKKGTFKVRAKEYVCQECGHTEDKKEHEEKLDAEIMYTCPFCDHKGEVVTPFQRRTWYGVKAIVFACDECGEKLGITKKMKTPDRFLEKL